MGRVLGVLGTVIKDLRRVSLRRVALSLGRSRERVGGKRSDRRTRRGEVGTKTSRSTTMTSTKACKRTIAVAVAISTAVEASRGWKRRDMRPTRGRKGLGLLGKLGVGRGLVGFLHLDTEKLQTFFDVVVVGIEVSGLGVGVE